MGKSMALGGGGRFAAYAKKYGKAAAIAHGNAKYGKAGMAALRNKGTKGAPKARADAKKIRNRKRKGTGGKVSFNDYVNKAMAT